MSDIDAIIVGAGHNGLTCAAYLGIAGLRVQVFEVAYFWGLAGTFQAILHKKANLAGTSLADLDFPLLETQDEWLMHGFSYANYLQELGEKAQSVIYEKSSVDLALKDAFRKMRRFLMNTKGLSEDEAIALMSAAIDFGVTQVVDGNWGVHAVLRKSVFGDASAMRSG